MIYDLSHFQFKEFLTECRVDRSFQLRFTFPNGYTGAVIQGPSTDGHEDGLWEMAVMVDGDLCYDTPITNDVIGFLTVDGVNSVLEQIAALPHR